MDTETQPGLIVPQTGSKASRRHYRKLPVYRDTAMMREIGRLDAPALKNVLSCIDSIGFLQELKSREEHPDYRKIVDARIKAISTYNKPSYLCGREPKHNGRITFMVKTLERPDCLRRLIRSVRRFYQTEKICVADDSRKPTLINLPHVRQYVMDHDIGPGAAYNRMLADIQTPYTVLLEDDFIFLKSTRIGRFLPFLEYDIADIAGGMVRNGRKDQHYELWLHRIGDTLHADRLPESDGPVYADCILNFFAAKTDILRDIGWNENLKVVRHIDFFLRAQEHAAKVMYRPGVRVWHNKEMPEAYGPYRKRAMDPAKQIEFLKTWGLQRMTGISDRSIEELEKEASQCSEKL